LNTVRYQTTRRQRASWSRSPANGVEAGQDGRIYVELVNRPFLNAGGTPDQYRAALERAVSLGWLWRHESGTQMKFTAAGAELFA
jgi:hypothetical protein